VKDIAWTLFALLMALALYIAGLMVPKLFME